MATDIGTSIKRARERMRWSQQRLADALKVDRKTVDNWENGRTRPRSSVGAIEEVLGVDLTGAPEPEPDVPRDVLEAIRREVPPEDQQRVIDAVARTLRGEPQPPTPPAEDESGRRRAG